MTISSTSTIRAYLGGSFDPVHQAHLDMAIQVYDALTPIALEQNQELQVSLLPNARSPFKQQSTEPKHRLAMLKLATKDTPLHIDELELWQPPPVYTIDSVRTLRQRYPHDSLIFIMGMDSVRSLDKWQNGLQLIDYVNLWVFDRHTDKQTAEYGKQSHIESLVSEIPYELQAQVTHSITDLLSQNSRETATLNAPLKNGFKGRIYINPYTVAKISSTDIRQQLHTQASRFGTETYANTQTEATDPKAIITQHSLSKQLNSAVYHYIIAHQLYSAD